MTLIGLLCILGNELLSVVCMTALAGSLASQIAPLELKVENHDKDDMHDNSSDGLKSDDESDKRDLKGTRAGTRPRQGPTSPKYYP